MKKTNKKPAEALLSRQRIKRGSEKKSPTYPNFKVDPSPYDRQYVEFLHARACYERERLEQKRQEEGSVEKYVN